MSEAIISSNNLSKSFKVYRNPWHRAVEWGSLGNVKKHEEFWALKDISFQVKKGECLGIIGANGAGKSTLLKILTGTLTPTSGEFTIRGNVLSLLELGTGFNAELTGKQNLLNSARLLGFPDSYIAERVKDIEEFSELGDFFDRPIKTYSSGMHVRLAFSMFVNMEPQILIIDEALSVGDVFFQQKSFARMREIIKSGTTCIFVSHDLSAVTNLCSKVLLLDKGMGEFLGEPEVAVNMYYSKVGTKRAPVFTPSSKVAESVAGGKVAITKEEILASNILGEAKYRYGTGSLDIIGLKVTDKNGYDTLMVDMMEPLTFHIIARANEVIKDPGLGINISDRLGNVVFACGNWSLGHHVPELLPGQELIMIYEIWFTVKPGEYTFKILCSEPAAEGPNTGYSLDNHDLLGPITVSADIAKIMPFFGMAKLPMTARSAIVPSSAGSSASGIAAETEKRITRWETIKKKDDRPLLVSAEWCRNCNLKCRMCVMSNPEFPSTGQMSLELWGKLLESCRKDDAIINWVHWHGEPFLWKHFKEGMRLWKESGLAPYGSIATNGQIVTDEHVRLVAETGIQGVRVGLDTTDPEIYKLHRVGGEFHKAIETIKKFLAIGPAFRVEVLLMRSAINSAVDYEDLYKLVGKPDNLICMTDWCQTTGGQDDMVYIKNPDPDPRKCMKLERACMVTFDGRVGLCCWDAWCKNFLGRFPETPSIRDIYFGEYADEVRRRIRSGDYSLAQACVTCSMDSDFKIMNEQKKVNR